MFKLGDLDSNLQALQDMRNQLILNKEAENHKSVEREKWGALISASNQISEACEQQDLSELVRAMRTMKNRLRRPAIRRELAILDQMESDEKVASDRVSDKEKERKSGKDSDGNPTGKCRCAKCDKIIDGSEGKCVEGALCVDCAMKKDVVSQKDKDEKNREKAVPPSGMMGGSGMGVGVGMSTGGVEVPREESKSSLRRRNYRI